MAENLVQMAENLAVLGASGPKISLWQVQMDENLKIALCYVKMAENLAVLVEMAKNLAVPGENGPKYRCGR